MATTSLALMSFDSPPRPGRRKLASKLLARVPKEILEVEQRYRPPPPPPAETPTTAGLSSSNPFSPPSRSTNGASTDGTSPERTLKTHVRTGSGDTSTDSLPFALSDETRRPHASVPVAALVSPLGSQEGGRRRTRSSTGTERVEGADILELLGEMSSTGRTPIRERVVMVDHKGDEFSIDEHTLSPVTERTEMSTLSSHRPGRKPYHASPLASSTSSAPPSSSSDLPFQNAHKFLINRFNPRPRPAAPFSPPSSSASLSGSVSAPAIFAPATASTMTPPTLTHSGDDSTPRPRMHHSATTEDLRLPPPQASGIFSAADRASVQRLPKKTAGLIAMFENHSSPPSRPAAASPPRSTTAPPPSSLEALESSRKARAALRHQRLVASETSASPALGPAFDEEADQERRRKRTERRERVAAAVEGASTVGIALPGMTTTALGGTRAARPWSPVKSPPSATASPLARVLSPGGSVGSSRGKRIKGLVHKKSVSSATTSSLSDSDVIHHGPLWHRDGATGTWSEHRAILTPTSLFLSSHRCSSPASPTGDEPTLELNLAGASAVESVRARRSFAPPADGPHLHLFRIVWGGVEDDHLGYGYKGGGTAAVEEVLGCTRAMHRADWVGSVWQAAHDLGGFTDRPDIPLSSSIGSSPRSGGPSTAHTSPINLSTAPLFSTPSPPASERTGKAPVLSPNDKWSSSSGGESLPTPSIRSELERDLWRTDGVDLGKMYSSEAMTQEELSRSLHELLGQPPSPGPGRPPIQTPVKADGPASKRTTPDFLAMVDRLSVHEAQRTSAFYDPPARQPRDSPGLRNPRPLSAKAVPDIAALEMTASRPGSTASRPASVRLASAATQHASEATKPATEPASTPRASVQYSLHDPGPVPPTPSPTGRTDDDATPRPLNRRGAWSDVDRVSVHTDEVVHGGGGGAMPARAVRRDLQRILTTISRRGTEDVGKSTETLGRHLDDIHGQLKGVAEKLREQQDSLEQQMEGLEVGATGEAGEEQAEPSISDKVDYMLSLCSILLESQHKVSSAVERSLHAHGINVDSRSAATRSRSSMRSMAINSRANTPTPSASRLSTVKEDEDKEKSDAEVVAPGTGGEEVEDAGTTTATAEAAAEEEKAEEAAAEAGEDPAPNRDGEEVAAQIAAQEAEAEGAVPNEPASVQEAGLQRMFDLLEGIMRRLDEESRPRLSLAPSQPPPAEPAAQPEQETAAPPEAEALDPTPRQSLVGDSPRISDVHSVVDFDADVALWRLRERGYTQSQIDAMNRPVPPVPQEEEEEEQVVDEQAAQLSIDDEVAAMAAQEAVPQSPVQEPPLPMVMEGEPEEEPEPAPEPAPAPVFLAEDAVADRIAEERERAARRLDGLATPTPTRAISRALGPRIASLINGPLAPAPQANPVPPPAAQPDPAPAPAPVDPAPPDPPPNVPAASPPAAGPAGDPPEPVVPSAQVPVQASDPDADPAADPLHRTSSSGTVSSRTTATQEPLGPPPITVDEVRAVLQEGLDQHAANQAPTLAEMMGLLTGQDQTSKSTLAHQADVARYLSQLNGFWEGDLQKRNDEWKNISDSIAKLQEHIYLLAERTNLALAQPQPQAQPVVNVEAAPVATVDGAPVARSGSARASAEILASDPTTSEPAADDAEGPPAPIEETPTESPWVKRPTMSRGVGGPRMRTIEFGRNGGPRGPNGLSTIGKLWGGPRPAGDRAARWGQEAADRMDALAPEGSVHGSVQRTPSGRTAPAEDAAAELASIDPEDPAAGEILEKRLEEGGLQQAGTIALGISHILKQMKDLAAREEERSRREEEEKAEKEKPKVKTLEEQRAEQIEELRKKRELALAEDKQRNLEALIAGLKQQTAEHDRLLRQIADDVEAARVKPPAEEEKDKEEEEQEKRMAVLTEQSQRVLEDISQGVATQLIDFKTKLTDEVKTMLEQVGQLREQKQMLQGDIASLFDFKSKHGGGAPDPHWFQPLPTPSVSGRERYATQTDAGDAPPAAAPPPAPASARSARLSTMYAAAGSYGGGVFGPRPPR